MYFLQVKWLHKFQEEPVVIYAELDDELWEIRKIEEFPDGTFGYADKENHTESTELSTSQYPPLEQIASNPEFELQHIDQEEFERVWLNSHS
ncbi:DUF6881 domain-containing protein [Gimesia aquarii]|uniref:DUF6881 domain-containing protein n=1 Tax=Gimesia aquarii TaxID=2527964 RepID=A0A517WUY0_9PLAN|nr:hypothetical protein [Gimesia aquarii]QDU09075.1 hypothetical protein V202x_24460 [Gimesia aquarii]